MVNSKQLINMINPCIWTGMLKKQKDQCHQGYDWTRLVFAHPFPLNSGAPTGYCLMGMHTHAGACPTNGGFIIQDQQVGTI